VAAGALALTLLHNSRCAESISRRTRRRVCSDKSPSASAIPACGVCSGSVTGPMLPGQPIPAIQPVPARPSAQKCTARALRSAPPLGIPYPEPATGVGNPVPRRVLGPQLDCCGQWPGSALGASASLDGRGLLTPLHGGGALGAASCGADPDHADSACWAAAAAAAQRITHRVRHR